MKGIRGAQRDAVNGQQETLGFAMHFRHKVILEVESPVDIAQDLPVKVRA
jgi:hypothetical protein